MIVVVEDNERNVVVVCPRAVEVDRDTESFVRMKTAKYASMLALIHA